jgi:DNA-binding transcriptional LysR family regulator
MLPDIARHSEKFYYFFEIANEGSLQATARKLGISAPSLSHAVKQLETVAGIQLFSRSKNGVTLTDAGEKLFVFCRKYFREMEEVQRLMEHPNQQTKRKVKIGTFQSIALYFWPLLIDSMKYESNISLSITTDRSRAILEALMRREVDIALTVGALKHKKLLKHELYKDQYTFYVSNSWKKAELKKSETYQHAILYIPDAEDENGKSLRQYLHSWGLVFRDEFELDSLEVVADFVKRGYGVGILPTKVAKNFGNTIKPIKIEAVGAQKFGTHRFYLSYRDDLEMPQSLMRILLDNAKRAAMQLNC